MTAIAIPRQRPWPGLNPRLREWMLRFMPALGRVFQPPIATAGAAAAVPWYLSGGIAAADCLIAYTPKGAANLAASYDNNAAPGNGLPDGTYDATPYLAAPTWAAGTGWTLDGINQSLNTNYNILNINNVTVTVRFSNVTNIGWIFCDTDGAAPYFGSRPVVGATHQIVFWNTAVGQAPALVAGVVGMAGQYVYVNGAPDVDMGAHADAGFIQNLYIGSHPWGEFIAADVQALCVHTGVRSAAEMLALETAMAAL